ncbi:Uncharacterised protein [uncultured Bacteroides sp.]|nr:Uncharacterised protein [uncultured Bacteroides sp.]
MRYIYHNGQIIGLAALNTLYQRHFSYMSIRTVGGLSTFSSDSGMGLYIGYISTEPETAKRDGKFETRILNEWVIEQYNILLQQGLTNKDKLWLPYNLCSFDIDMCDILMVYFANKSNLFSTDLKSLLSLIAKGSKLVFAIAPHGDDDRIDTYTDRERSLNMLNDNEYLFIPCTLSDFLSTEIKDNCYFNIISCIKTVAAKMELKIQFKLTDDKTYSIFEGVYKGLILSRL